MEHFPLIPVEDDGRLNDPIIRGNCILQIFTKKRWRDNLAAKRGMGKLVNFHTRNKLLLMSHSPKHYRSMGKLVADGKKMPIRELYDQYQLQLVEALKMKTTIRKNINVLQHLMGYFKKQLSRDEKQELLEVFDHYRNKLLIMSHSPKHYRSMGKLVADGKKMPIQELHQQYQLQLVEALKLKTTIKKNINVLQHRMGYFKKQMSTDEKQELLEVFDQYLSEYVPLIVPKTLINQHMRKYDQPYLKQRTYLNPHPLELKLRTHV